MALDEPGENDITNELEGFTFIIDKDLARKYPNYSIVYQNGLVFKGLRIYAEGTSGC